MLDIAALGLDEDELNRQLSKVKTKLFFKKGAAFLATIMAQTKFVWDMSEPTAWTDGVTIGFNPVFFMSICDDARVTVLAHELWHIAQLHMERQGNRDPDIFNDAGDHVINLRLKEHGYSFQDIEFVLMDQQFRNMGTEEVYDKLIQNQKRNGGGGNKPKPGSSSGSGSSKPIPLRGDVRPSPKDKQMEVLQKVVTAVQTARMTGNAGDIPGEITLTVDKFLNPKLPWQQLLHRFFTEQSKEDYSWKRPSRRYEDEYLPSLHGEDGLTTINYYLDISGSISDGDILRFNSEVAHIKKEFNPELLHLITFDTRIRDEYTFTQDEPFEKIIVTGRGGTSLVPVQKHILKTKPNVAVIFSDLEVPPMQSVGNIPVLWIVIGNPCAEVPFGKMVHIDQE